MWGRPAHQAPNDCGRFTFGHREAAAMMLPCWELIGAVETLPTNELIGVVEID